MKKFGKLDVAFNPHMNIIVGADFSGDTIRNHAKKKMYTLITVAQLVDIARAGANRTIKRLRAIASYLNNTAPPCLLFPTYFAQ